MSIAIGISFLLYRAVMSEDLSFLVLENEKVVSIDMAKLGEGQVSLNVRGELGEESVSKEVILQHTEENTDSRDYSLSENEKLSLEISQIVRDINKQNPGMVSLPTVSPDGARITWNVPESGHAYLFPLVIPIFVLFYMYRGEVDKENQKSKREEERVLRELPGFNNKLVLLMESGLIYEEAVEKICGSSLETDGIVKIFSDAINESKQTNGRAEIIISDYAREKKLPELSRFISIVRDSLARGTDLREKLKAEGAVLWDKRKKQAEEQGKLADTKLALPLGMMLLSLLIITAAPALMQF